MNRYMLIALTIGKWIGTIVVVLALTIYFGRAFDARRMAPLGSEHRIKFANEFTAAQEKDTDWVAYLNIEKKLATELKEKIPSDEQPDSPADRYFADSLTYPDNYPTNWNHSY